MLEVLELADLDVLDQIDDVADRVRIDAAHERRRRCSTELDAIASPRDHGRRRGHAGHEPHVVERVVVVGEPARSRSRVDGDVRVVAEDLALQVLPEAAHHADHAAERARAHGDAAGSRERR